MLITMNNRSFFILSLLATLTTSVLALSVQDVDKLFTNDAASPRPKFRSAMSKEAVKNYVEAVNTMSSNSRCALPPNNFRFDCYPNSAVFGNLNINKFLLPCCFIMILRFGTLMIAVTKEMCEARGCCYFMPPNSVQNKVPICFYPTPYDGYTIDSVGYFEIF